MSQPPVALVTDSSCGLPVDAAERVAEFGELAADITVVILPVTVGDRDLTAAEADQQLPLLLAQGEVVTTSRPAAGVLAQVYQGLAEAGFQAVLSAHLPASLSGTVEAALLAAEMVDIPVTVFDAAQTGLGLGWSVMHASSVARTGAGVREVQQACAQAASAARTVLSVPNLDQLHRSGRISGLKAWLGSLRKGHTLLALRDGQLGYLNRVNGWEQVMAELSDQMGEGIQRAQGEDAQAHIAVHHVGNLQQARQLAEVILQDHGVSAHITDLPAVLGAHVGIGAIGVIRVPDMTAAI